MSDDSRRRTFGPVVLAGVAAGALGAVAGGKPWVVDADAPPAGEAVQGVSLLDRVDAAGQMPVALALSLVLLAVWGVILVTRGRVRRAVSALGALAAAGLAASVVVGLLTLPTPVAEAITERSGAGEPETALTAWLWAAALAGAASLVATVLAVLWAPAWPEMGSRYDAPGAAVADDPTHLDLWKSIDEGRDPTA